MTRKLSRPAHALSIALVAIAFALASCSSVLGVDDYKDSTTELCDLLHACYKYDDCEVKIGTRLDQASATDRTLWLASLSDKSCLDQCSSARRCLNIKPVCTTLEQACGRKEDCCGFLGGKAECKGPPNDKHCCKAAGAECNSKQDDCCPDKPCDTHTGTCGGVICSSAGQLCKNNFDCCSNFCRNNLCRDEICTEVGSTCNKDTDTCCDNSQCLDGVCGFKVECKDQEQKCSVNSSAPDPWACCAGLTCVPYGEEIIPEISTTAVPVGICRTELCLPENLPCKETACCEGLYCDPFKSLCGQRCGGPKSSCQNDWDCCSNTCVGATAAAPGTCDCSQGACVDHNDCCSDVCVQGACAPGCNTLDTTCHSVCLVGAPLSPECIVNGSALGTTECASDPYCCCVGWDDLCVENAIQKYFGDSVCF